METTCRLKGLLVVLCGFWISGAAAQEREDQTDDEYDPVLERIQTESWRDYPVSPIDRRIALEDASEGNPFAITPHLPSYLLPVTYNSSPNPEPWRGESRNELNEANLKDVEAKFQISLKAVLLKEVFDPDLSFSFAYTQQSYWQLYNREASRPFRETIHEPELFLSLVTDWRLFGIRHRLLRLGVVHQSNGQSDPFSRSWNRIYAEFVFEKDNLVVGLRPWYRLEEDENRDDNPDIHQYLGYGDLRFNYYLENHEFSLLLRNNLRSSKNRGAVQLEWSFPLYKKIRGYVQYFNGYGENLIDYNDSTNRIGLGVMLINWL